MDNLLVETNGKIILWKRLGQDDAAKVNILLKEFALKEPLGSIFTTGTSERKKYLEEASMVSDTIKKVFKYIQYFSTSSPHP